MHVCLFSMWIGRILSSSIYFTQYSCCHTNALSKGQLTRTFCERLFCSSSNARIGVSSRQSRLQVAVDCTPKWTATCSRLGRVDSGIILAVCARPAAVEKTQLQRRVYALCDLTRLPVSVFLADHTGVHSTPTLIPTASCRLCELL